MSKIAGRPRRIALESLEARLLLAGDPAFMAPYSIGAEGATATAGDFDGDGDLDFAAAAGAGGIQAFMNFGDATFLNSEPPSGLVGPARIASGDFDADGLIDLAAADSAAGQLSILRSAGGGAFAAPSVLAALAQTSDLAVADFSGDHVVDIAVASRSAGVGTLINQGDGTFAPLAPLTASGDYRSIIAADLTGDGSADLVASRAAQIDVFVGAGDGTFAAAVSYSAGVSGGTLAAGDFNGDGRIDLAVGGPLEDGASPASANVAILLNDGSGGLHPPQSYASGTATRGVVAADFNGDGRVDVATSDATAGIVILTGDGTGALAAPVAAGAPRLENLALAGDFTNSGRVDLIGLASDDVFLNATPFNADHVLLDGIGQTYRQDFNAALGSVGGQATFLPDGWSAVSDGLPRFSTSAPFPVSNVVHGVYNAGQSGAADRSLVIANVFVTPLVAYDAATGSLSLVAPPGTQYGAFAVQIVDGQGGAAADFSFVTGTANWIGEDTFQTEDLPDRQAFLTLPPFAGTFTIANGYDIGAILPPQLTDQQLRDHLFFTFTELGGPGGIGNIARRDGFEWTARIADNDVRALRLQFRLEAWAAAADVPADTGEASFLVTLDVDTGAGFETWVDFGEVSKSVAGAAGEHDIVLDGNAAANHVSFDSGVVEQAIPQGAVVRVRFALKKPDASVDHVFGIDDFSFRTLLPGDLDGDGTVSFIDALTALSYFGNLNSGATWAEGDIDGDGAVGFFDLLELLSYFGISYATLADDVFAQAGSGADADVDSPIADSSALRRSGAGVTERVDATDGQPRSVSLARRSSVRVFDRSWPV